MAATGRLNKAQCKHADCEHGGWPVVFSFCLETLDGEIRIDLCDCCLDALKGRVIQEVLTDAMRAIPWSAWQERGGAR